MEPSRYTPRTGLLMTADKQHTTDRKPGFPRIHLPSVPASQSLATSAEDPVKPISPQLDLRLGPNRVLTNVHLASAYEAIGRVQKIEQEHCQRGQPAFNRRVRLRLRSIFVADKQDWLDEARDIETPQEKRNGLHLMNLIALGCVEHLQTKLNHFHGSVKAKWWTRAFGLACVEASLDVLQCLLVFFLPVHRNGTRLGPRMFKEKQDDFNMLHALARYGLVEGAGNMESLASDIINALKSSLIDERLLLTRNLFRKTPLHLALENGRTAESFICFLLYSTPPVSLRKLLACFDFRGWTYLHQASSNRLVNLTRRLIEAGANVNARTDDLKTPLHLTFLPGSGDTGTHEEFHLVIRLFCDNGADLDARDRDGNTPLHLAAASYMRSASAFAPWQRNNDWNPVPAVCSFYPAWKVEWVRNTNFTVAADKHVPVTVAAKKYVTVHDLLYTKNLEELFQVAEGNLTWLHLYSNNIEWCDELLTRWYLGKDSPGHRPKANFEAASRAFNQQHVTRTQQSRFMRPGVQCTHPDYSDVRGKMGPAKNSKTAPTERIIFIAAPYMYFETTENLKEMRDATKELVMDEHRKNRSISLDKRLYAAYTDSGEFHPRRTLDQYVHYNMDTSERDFDQVVQRFQKNDKSGMFGPNPDKGNKASASHVHDIGPTMIMVDQLWMWILGNTTLVTCFPRKWNQGESDPYGVLEGLIQTIDMTGEKYETAGDLALQVMEYCFSVLERHARTQPRLQFLSMFEQTIGRIGAEESVLLREFAQAYNKGDQQSSVATNDVPPFAKQLNNLTSETNLLSELKDVRDELSMMSAVFQDQQRVSDELFEIQQKLHRHGLPLLFNATTPAFRQFVDLRDPFESIDAGIKQSLQEIATMDSQAARFGQLLSELLELKQAHSNAFELSFSRQFSLDAARQSRAVLVFTIVTIVFSPLSFVATFFTMPLTNLPKDTMTLAYVSKYIFVLGFAVALPCIIIAFSVNKLGLWTFTCFKPRRDESTSAFGPRVKGFDKSHSEGLLVHNGNPVDLPSESHLCTTDTLLTTRAEADGHARLKTFWRKRRAPRLPDISPLPR